MAHAFKAILLGVITLLVLIGLFGGPNGFGALAILIICTGGIGLIPVLFAAWLIGLLLLSFYRLFRMAGATDSSSTAVAPSTVLLSDYIRKVRAQGTDEERINAAIKKAGWNSAEIDVAMRLAKR